MYEYGRLESEKRRTWYLETGICSIWEKEHVVSSNRDI
jgi:hypothetical protein